MIAVRRSRFRHARRLSGARGLFVRPRLTSLEARAVPASFSVTNLNDSGAGSFRQAVLDTNSFAGPDTVDATGVTGTINLSGGQMSVTGDTTILGPGSGKLTLNNTAAASATSRVFNINSPTPGTSVSISGLTVSGGNLSTGNGAGLLVQAEDMTLADVVLTGNVTAGDGGGFAVAVGGNRVTMTNCFISNNSATSSTSQGGGAYFLNPTSFVLTNSTVSGNKSGEDGGGVYFLSGGTLMMECTTVSDNQANLLKARKGGGGLYLFGNTFNGAIRNCTISGNSATNGGGIVLRGSGNLTVENSTVAFNAADKGGGISNQSTMTLTSVLVANNSAPAGPDVVGLFSANFSLFGISSGATITGANNLTNVDPLLSALADNGGPTRTHALQAGSPAIDAGSNPATLSTDQRGTGFGRIAGPAIDIGAFEWQNLPTVTGVTLNGGEVQRSRVTSIAVTFSAVVTLPADPATAFQLVRQGDNAVVDLTANVANGAQTVVTLTFNGGLSEFGSLADGRYTLTVVAANVSTAGGQLDGDNNSLGGDEYFLVGDPATNQLHRLFGDDDGDGDTDAADLLLFRDTFGTSSADAGFNPNFDFDGDGDVDGADFLQFRPRFGSAV